MGRKGGWRDTGGEALYQAGTIIAGLGVGADNCQGVETLNPGKKSIRDGDQGHHQEWIPRLKLTQQGKHNRSRHH